MINHYNYIKDKGYITYLSTNQFNSKGGNKNDKQTNRSNRKR